MMYGRDPEGPTTLFKNSWNKNDQANIDDHGKNLLLVGYHQVSMYEDF